MLLAGLNETGLEGDLLGLFCFSEKIFFRWNRFVLPHSFSVEVGDGENKVGDDR
jgi:hypothetical protein